MSDWSISWPGNRHRYRNRAVDPWWCTVRAGMNPAVASQMKIDRMSLWLQHFSFLACLISLDQLTSSDPWGRDGESEVRRDWKEGGGRGRRTERNKRIRGRRTAILKEEAARWLLTATSSIHTHTGIHTWVTDCLYWLMNRRSAREHWGGRALWRTLRTLKLSPRRRPQGSRSNSPWNPW